MTDRQVHICVVCAWRGDCKKKFSVSKDPNPFCADFSRDVRIKNVPEDDPEERKKSKD